ncbi:conserved hypothetical protein [Histoplasma capsulatum var. duboisii H88]|uniref:Calcofluor white hypersensitive protein n=3 Tax=Ajellomyces capsulatus TaxID=5037 RepID=C0NGM5_AJECG|nr:uncharacterized protein HCBG_02497 [Histoplasma capsulatum G186AR]EGC42276.1 conserved hypothetical protein [Histoplasma capsulatum var. duboisii H88]KAG5303723.1 hypothetical protein I7I52_01807 [Histoplasma capsulatum]EEH08960.1 predicted protein [Histoplasma capsulatum G186AR]QSS51315.1 hypothetical protein I7I53_06606 [Histoplasma capsulatum var. duboisii H88]QSS69319.1 hypothetical protein I7I50_10568 [Histoplasma capsulatum G186AR]
MSKSRMPVYLGLAAAGAGGYYLYRAGGDPKRATRKFEDDASRAGSKIRDESNKALGHGSAEQVGASIDHADERATKFAKEEAEKLNKARKDVAKDINEKIDSFDKSVEHKAAEAQKGISSWFGGKK